MPEGQGAELVSVFVTGKSTRHGESIGTSLGKFDHDLTVLPKHMELRLIKGIIPKWPYSGL